MRLSPAESSLALESVNAVDSSAGRYGGHIGFLIDLLPTQPTLLDRSVSEFVFTVFRHPESFSVTVTTDDAEDNGVLGGADSD
ncbi:unnamed protein product [Hydatigera taeniaeformis]|uniref:Cadherin domain-containing protein n=1 Tax=Hydatigena taeniaeformis TaxID=6205 RepID=A0A0R3WPU5_HYDTA|nr:unnamed protein product [Hydatigera taeniaeformis]